MSLFSAIKDKIFGHAATPQAHNSDPTILVPQAHNSDPTAPIAQGASPSLDAVLTSMAASAGQQLNWQSSIVDLMKLVGIDSSLANRKSLATELGYTGDMGDSASMNIWLHAKTMDKLRAGL